MQINKFKKQFAELQQESQNYHSSQLAQSKQVTQRINDRLDEINELLKPDSLLLRSIAANEKPVSALTVLMQERDTLKKIQGQYNFDSIARIGLDEITDRMKLLDQERLAYFEKNIEDDNAEEFIANSPTQQREAMTQMLLRHQADKQREVELEKQVEPFMADLEKLLQQPHVKKFDLSTMLHRARGINPECIAAAEKLHKLPLLA